MPAVYATACAFQTLREENWPVFKSDVMGWADRMIDQDPAVARFFELDVDGKHHVSSGWYTRFIKRCKFSTTNQKPIEIDRAKWLTSTNMKAYYNVFENVCIKAGVGKRMADGRFIITHPERIMSFDETSVTNDMTAGKKGKGQRTVTAGAEDKGACNANKGGGRASFAGGSLMTGLALPLFAVCAAGAVPVAWEKHLPKGMVVGAEGELVKAVLKHNKKGSVDGAMCIQYLEEVVAKCFPDVSPTNGVVMICDGCPTHITFEFLSKARAMGVHIVLRPPHTTSMSQGEDVANFGPFKDALEKSRSAFATKKSDGKSVRKPLCLDDMMEIAMGPWETAFSVRHNRRGWEVTGLFPYTRCVEHELRKSEVKKRKIETDFREAKR